MITHSVTSLVTQLTSSGEPGTIYNGVSIFCQFMYILSKGLVCLLVYQSVCSSDLSPVCASHCIMLHSKYLILSRRWRTGSTRRRSSGEAAPSTSPREGPTFCRNLGILSQKYSAHFHSKRLFFNSCKIFIPESRTAPSSPTSASTTPGWSATSCGR